MSEKIDIPVHLKSSADADTLEQFFTLQERVRITGAVIIDQAGIVAAAGNYRTITVANGAGTSTYYTWSTRTADQGALTAGTSASLIVGSATDPEFEAGTLFKVRSAATGAGKAQNSIVVLQCEKLRKFTL